MTNEQFKELMDAINHIKNNMITASDFQSTSKRLKELETDVKTIKSKIPENTKKK